jgi:site-specific recombinase XerC
MSTSTKLLTTGYVMKTLRLKGGNSAVHRLANKLRLDLIWVGGKGPGSRSLWTRKQVNVLAKYLALRKRYEKELEKLKSSS